MKEQQMELLKSTHEYLPRFKQGINELAQEIKIRVSSKEREQIIEMIEGIQWIVEAVDLTRDIQVEPIDVEGTRILFLEMIEALENDDMILLGDLLEYELASRVDIWEKQIEVSVG